MSLNPRIWLRAAIVAAVFYFACPARATIDYTVSLAHPERHIFGVTMRIPKVRDQVTLQMPAWNALYQIRDFSSHMMQVTAKDEEGHSLPLRKLDKQTWNVTANGTVTISYPIFWDEPGPFASQLNPDHAFLNFAMLLLYVPDRRTEDTKVAFDDVPEGWRVAVELDAAGTAGGHHSAPMLPRAMTRSLTRPWKSAISTNFVWRPAEGPFALSFTAILATARGLSNR